MSEINIGEILESLNNKADRNLRNIDIYNTDAIVEYQEPTAENNYTWYRLYASGWVEQGGHYTHNNVEGTVTTTLSVTMADTHYTITMSKELSSASNTNCAYEFMPAYVANSKTTTSFQVRMTTANRLNGYDWQVCGKADMTGHPIPIVTQEKQEFEHRVIAFQKPTADNNYSWYRKYADGWVEQGGISTGSTYAEHPKTVSLLVTMADSNYTLLLTKNMGDADGVCPQYESKNTTEFKWSVTYRSALSRSVSWQVSGMAA